MDSSWLTSGFAGAAAIAGWWAATNGVRAIKQTRAENKAKSRPMLAAELKKVPHVKASQALVIRNFGPSVAKNLVVTFDPPIPDPPPDLTSQSVTPFLKRRYSRPIRTVTPGMELTNLWFVAIPGEGGKWKNAEPTPETCTVTLTYEATNGDQYVDQFEIDVSLLRMETTSTSSTSPDAVRKDTLAQLKKIERSLAQLANSADQAAKETPLSSDVMKRLLNHQPKDVN